MTDLLPYWAMAQASPLGIRILVDDPGLLRQQLYQARATSGAYKELGIILPDLPNQLWIVHANADERRAFDEIQPLHVHPGPGFPAKKVRGPEREQGGEEDNQESGEGDAK